MLNSATVACECVALIASTTLKQDSISSLRPCPHFWYEGTLLFSITRCAMQCAYLRGTYVCLLFAVCYSRTVLTATLYKLMTDFSILLIIPN